MRFPTFRPDDLLSKWSDCTPKICCGCGQSSHPPVKLLLGKLGDITFKSYLSRLRCEKCKRLPGPIYLCTGHYPSFCGGGAPDWALEVVADPPLARPIAFQDQGEFSKVFRKLGCARLVLALNRWV